MLVPNLPKPKTPYEYPEHLREQVLAAPRAPGVYLFFAEDGDLPLYIGKSVDIRARLLSHLRTQEEAHLLRQTRRIEYRLTAGEIGALLLESKLIKELQPLTNKRLRRKKRLCSIRLQGLTPELVDTTWENTGQLYGLFKSRKAAKEALLELADQERLCHTLLGLEHPSGRACFRAQIGKCAGACCGKETREAHHQRLQASLAQWQVYRWPFAGAIALYESCSTLQEYHVINQWHYLGTYSTEEAARQASSSAPQPFDADSYKILVRPIIFGLCNIIDFSTNALTAQFP
ncbi:excinuclease Cho [Ectopseudomonas mendocina]|uniref:Excinuclease cho n=1 Tax=Ectopseudomonas mendocina TaxID=300 RepID=A0ABZ2RBP2_ECTME